MLSNRSDTGRLDNDNPVLQLAVFAALTRRLLGSVPDSVKAWCGEALDVSRKSKAIWHRSPEHGAQVLNSHDNYAAIAVLEPLGCGRFATEICEVGELTGFVFDNRDYSDPNQYYDIKAARQLGDVALYKICCTEPRMPNLLETVWMTLGLLILALKPMNFHHHLGWLRLEALRIRLAERVMQKPWAVVNACSLLAILAYDLSMQIRYKSRFSAVFRYYSSDDKHPIRQLAKLLDARVNQMKITEGTLIPISLVITIVGGASWLTTIHAGEKKNAENILEIKAQSKEFSDKVDHKLDTVLDRLARIEEQLKQIGDK